jgi:hypothetical protein
VKGDTAVPVFRINHLKYVMPILGKLHSCHRHADDAILDAVMVAKFD